MRVRHAADDTLGLDRMLRLQPQRGTKELPGVHDPQYAQSAYTLHRVGQELLVQVRVISICMVKMGLLTRSK